MLSACGGDTQNTVTVTTLQSIAVTPASPSIAKGLKQQLTATGTYSDGTSQLLPNVTWSSAATSVATVNSAGLASGITAGNSIITATFNGISGNTTLTVTAATLQSIAVTPASPSIAKGLKQQLTATGTYSDGTSQLLPNVTWSSAATSVATVNSAGLASGITAGNSIITATFNGISGNTTLTVTAATLQSIAVTPTNPSIAKGLKQQLTATGTYSDGTSQLLPNVTWSSAATSVATVNSAGLASGITAGNSIIRAAFNGISGNTTLTVTAATLQSIAVTPTNPSIAKGLKQQLTATGTYSDGTSQLLPNVTWSSAATSVATVNSAGLASGITAGNSIIRAAFNGISGNTTLTVTAATLQSIAVTPTNPSIAKGLKQQLTATGTYSDGTSQLLPNVTWSSAATSVATVNSAGLASGITAGNSIIRAAFNGISGNTTLTVTAATLQSIAVTPTNPSIAKGLKQQLTATGTYSDGTSQLLPNVTWSSAATSVATVNSAGLASGITAGNSIITATFNGISGNTTLTVTAATLQSIAVTPTNPSIAKGLKQQLTATGTYSDGTSQLLPNVTWSSATTSVATVNSAGLASGITAGNSIIRAAFNGISGNTTLTVTAATLQSIAVTPTNPSIAKGLKQQLTATGTYSDGTSQLLPNVTWSSAATSVATVNSAGLASGITAGNSIIRATFNGISGNSALTVTAAIPQSIAITPANPSIAKGATLQLNAVSIYSDGSEQPLPNVNWSSNNSTLVSVNTNGLVAGVGVGSAQISARFDLDFISTSVTVNPPPPPAPTLTIKLNVRGPTYPLDDNIEWSSTNTTSCSASGSWSGSKNTAGSYTLPIPSTGTYILTCNGSNGGTVTKSVTNSVTVTLGVPIVSISVSPSRISAGGSATLIWSATNNPISCTASGSWSGEVAASGNIVVRPSSGLTSQLFYYITCRNSAGTSAQRWAILNVF